MKEDKRWSPFDPEWYKEAFDKFIYTADQLFNTDLILQQGFCVPDVDGSRSSVFRNEAVLNNSFNEKQLRETLKDIYLNSSYKLTANNHDNTHFFQWVGHISDLNIIANTNTAEFVIPTDSFIYPNERDKFKLSQLYRRWIKVEDVLNNWDIFKWVTLVFLDQKIFSDYELRIDDHEVTIRFHFYDYWVKADYPIYIYKMDTMSSCRINISKHLCEEEWGWKIPVSILPDQRILNSDRVIVAINKMREGRTDGLTNIEVVGDNLEFLEIKDGFIDISNISKFNKIYIKSESTQYLWMSIFVPKFLHEYPILLPVDSIYRPYEADFQPVTVMKNDVINYVKVDHNGEQKQVYIDKNGHLEDKHEGWKQMIRPIVLADAFDKCEEPYEFLIDDVEHLKDLTIEGADLIEEFRFFLHDYTPGREDEFNEYLQRILNKMDEIRNSHNSFLDRLSIEHNAIYENQYEKFLRVMDIIKNEGYYSEYLTHYDDSVETENDYFFLVSPLIYIPRELADKYYVIHIIHHLTDHDKHLWDQIGELLNQIRFQRPVDESDFWTFKYYLEDNTWRPYPLNIERHFPDVYLLEDPNEKVPALNGVFKAFFFYSDTINVLNESQDIVRATPSWDEDMAEYHFDQEGVYRDIFMEKFYWMGVRSIYKGILATHNRWEAIEYIIDNSSYERFNELFLKTMDPYFKLGLATYLKSSNFGFPFDDAISKIEESINMNWLGYKKVTNFEMYLNKTWIPSYFDYIVKIMDNWDWGNRLLRRPRSSFDTTRILPILLEMQESTFDIIKELNSLIEWIILQLKKENYNLNIDNFTDLKNIIYNMYVNMKYVLDYTKELDLDIFSIEDINHIIKKLEYHNELIEQLTTQFDVIYQDANKNNVYEDKRELLNELKLHVDHLPELISKLSLIISDFDMEAFMKAINDLSTYFIYNKENPNDNSLLYRVNEFEDPWSMAVKEKRNKLFQSTSILYGTYQPTKSYSRKEIEELIHNIDTVKDDITNFRSSIVEFYEYFKYNTDQIVIDRLDNVWGLINELKISVVEYLQAREEFLEEYEFIINLLNGFDKFNISITEDGYRNGIKESLENMLAALSYITGANNREDAVNALANIDEIIDTWFEFINTEENVFNKIFVLSKPPIKFLEVLADNNDILQALIEYMKTADYEFKPDSSWPTYSDIYQATEVELVSGGFRHKEGDIVFVKNLGTYRIVRLSGKVATAVKIEDVFYRNLSYRDPMCQFNPYDSTTSGNGLGLVVKPTKVEHTRIMNDDIVKRIITNVQNAVYLLKKDTATYNPRNNDIFVADLETIKRIKTSWDEIVNIYWDYMSETTRKYINDLVTLSQTSIDPSMKFMELRELVVADELINNFDSFISSAYKYAKEKDILTESFYYGYNLLIDGYNNFFDFYEGGTGWSDGSKLKEMADGIERPINFFKATIMKNWDSEELLKLYNQIIEHVSNIKSVVKQVTDSLVDISPIIRLLENKLGEVPELQKDVWYKIKFSKVAIGGFGYAVGDVVELIPQLPTDQYGNEIDTMSDVILNDVILLQVTSIGDDGEVTGITPLLDYAIPYLIWGIRETKTRVGEGYGLTVDIYSYELEIGDSTLFNDPKSYIATLPQFNENDMFAFKFENIHDLDIHYEVFIGGKQITNFFQRHLNVADRYSPSNMDVIYLNANEVLGLKNSSIYIPAENYFVYQIDDIIIKDPGAGYCEGQDIILDTSIVALRLKVAKLILEPYKGIAEVEVNGKITSNGEDPNTVDGKVITDSLNNIDDEYNVGYYDKITSAGVTKKLALSVDGDEYTYQAKRFDNMDDDDRNATFMYPDVNMPNTNDAATNGDPDGHWYLGSRIDNSQHPMEDKRIWNGISNIIPPTDPFIPDRLRMPDGKPIKGEYQEILRERFHNSDSPFIEGDLVVPTYADLPKHREDYPEGRINKWVVVEDDETHSHHRMAYRIRTFIISGFFVYDNPVIADKSWNAFHVDFMNIDFYPDIPTTKAKYPNADWRNKSFRKIEEDITDGKVENKYPNIKKNKTSYISLLSVDDLSVFNWTTKKWEDLTDTSRWRLDVINDDEISAWNFTLTFLGSGNYSYDMILYLNKIPSTQQRNALLKRNAVMDVMASILYEVDTKAINTSVNTGRHVRIRKLFPYEQKESYSIGYNNDGSFVGYEMDFQVANYMHFKNELHLEDVKIYNRSAGRFEDLLDISLFEVRFKDPKALSRGFETQTKIIQSLIGNPGTGFVDGDVWGWNAEFGIHLFGRVTADYTKDGHLITFEVTHCPNPPKEDISLEFNIFQRASQSTIEMATVLVEFITERVELFGDGYIHNVRNKLAPLPKEFKVIVKYDLTGPEEYDIMIKKTHHKWTFIEPKWLMSPTFHIDDSIPMDRLYVLTDNGRFPLVNPATGKPTLHVVENWKGTDVTFLNLYRRYEHLHICSTPYPMRSVYVQRRIPKSGFIDLKGKINKPLNKKYFEFWVNGKLLFDEVTIVSPTKIFLHGLTSLKNLEIIEINRDSNEYFSDNYLELSQTKLGRPYAEWNYQTYLDGALEGTLEGDNYTKEEQADLLSPVWPQVDEDHPEFKNYPPNVDVDPDVLLRTNPEDYPINDLEDPSYQFLVINQPTIEGKPVVEQTLTFRHFGLIPISEDTIIDILNEEWKEEIENDPYLPEHAVLTDAEWYGLTTRLYDEFGILVHTLDESVYNVTDTNLLKINTSTKVSRIVKNYIKYDLS